MKKTRVLFISFLITLCLSFSNFLFAEFEFNYNSAPVKIVFDPANSMLSLPIPLPNNINSSILNADGSALYLPLESTDSPAFQLLKTAVNSLGIKGLAPNTLLSIPLNSDTKLDLTSLYLNIFLIPFMTNLSSTPTPNYTPSIIAGPDNLEIYQNGNVLEIGFKEPLLPDSQYVVIINKGVKTAEGDLVGHDPAMELLIKTQYNTLISSLGLNCNDILAAITFSTAANTLKLSAFSKLLAGAPFNTTDILSYTNSKEELSSIVAATNLMPSTVTTNTTKSYNGINYFETTFNSYDITTLTTTPTPLNVPTIILPNGKTDKIVIFQHGLSQTKENALALASKFLSAGYPIIAMDLPEHGERVDYTDTSKDCNMDGTVSSGECFLTTNLVQDRINFYQSVFDLTLLLKDLKAGKFDINGDGTGDTVNKIYFVGLSLGSITGSIFAEYNIDDLEKVALSVGGADLAVLLDNTKIPDLVAAIQSLGIEKESGEYYTFLGLLHLILDPSDPLYQVDSTIKDKTLIQTAYGDLIVPNSSNAILSGKIGYYTPTVITEFTDNTAITDPTAGWYQFGGNIDGIDYNVPHTFLLSPETEKYYLIDPNTVFDKDFVNNAYNAAQNQIINFFNK